MEQHDIYRIFEAGAKFGKKHGIFPKENLMTYFHNLDVKGINDDNKNVLWTVIIAGFNYGSNLPKEKKLNDLELFDCFENLIEGKPLHEGDAVRYDIKEKIEEITTPYKPMTAKEAAEQLIAEKFPIEQYQEVQNARINRMKLWKEREIGVLIEKEAELIAFGEEVLSLMKEAYNKPKPLNEEQLRLIKKMAIDPNNQDTDLNLLVKEVLAKYPELDFKVVYDAMFKAVIGF